MSLRGRLINIYRLGIKELWSLWRDPAMLFLIVYTTTLAVYTAGTAQPETLYHVPIAIVDEDGSALSERIASAFYPPQFTRPLLAHRLALRIDADRLHRVREIADRAREASRKPRR